MKKHSLTIAGHSTSVTLEDEFWQALKEISEIEKHSINQLVKKIDSQRGSANLSSAIRVYILKYYQK